MRETFEFNDFDERRRHVPVDEIVEVMEPTGRVHDNGSLRLRDGRTIAFGNGDHWRRALDAMRGKPS